MLNASQIAANIYERVGRSLLPSWRVGLTHDPQQRRKTWGAEGLNTARWTCWRASSLVEAQKVERHFINSGMDGGTGGDLSSFRPVFVYIL